MMNAGELMTRATIWGALLCYAWGTALLLSARSRECRLDAARTAWTMGCIFFVAHSFCAFHFYHHWSHAEAYAETARQTEGMTGVRSGSGLFLNYLFGIVWITLVAWWWISPVKFIVRSGWSLALWNGFAIFMIFNGTVVFGKGPVRWFGGAICLGLAILWWRQRRGRAFSTSYR